MSVIIPAWNAADTLRRCVESVLAAAAGVPVEIIVVDDGSTDGTAACIRSLAAGNGRIHGVFQENRGVSSARNRGLACATGDWLAFVDADDTLAPGSLALADRAPDADILIARSFDGKRERYPWLGVFSEGRSYSAAALLQRGYLRGSVCGCLFRRDFLTAAGLRFPEGVRLSEDTVFFGASLAQARAIAFCNKDFYHISARPGSASRRPEREDVHHSAAAIEAALRDITDPAVRSYTLYKLILMLASRAVRAGVPASETRAAASLQRILPLPLAGIGGERWKIRLLNASWPLFYRLVALRDRHRPLRRAR